MVRVVESTIAAYPGFVKIHIKPTSALAKYGIEFVCQYVQPLNVHVERIIWSDDGKTQITAMEQTNIGLRFPINYKRRYKISDEDEQKYLTDGIPYEDILSEQEYVLK